MNRQWFQRGALISLLALVALTLAWELWLAPLRPGGSFLAFKALLLLTPLMGIIKGRLYTFQWASMFILAFFTEGVMRSWADSGLSQQLAMAEVGISVVFFGCVLGFARTFKLHKS
ncbi:DUF2069 domain-containing protein [uncultured Aquitalea sp.]|uniref:DUF2069 domain-containing protein n=1 Tax=uncultured Aquitalea sp. TaxID=540272 RepID=UPI0025D69B75|nr:DUF2069 domain-containing protein [uncultured Aquitalea sp.]